MIRTAWSCADFPKSLTTSCVYGEEEGHAGSQEEPSSSLAGCLGATRCMGLGNVCNDDFFTLVKRIRKDARNPRTMAGSGLIISNRDRANQQLDAFISLQKGCL